MKKQTLKQVRWALGACALAFATTASVNVFSASADNEEPAATTPVLTVEGAQIKSEAPAGMRFVTSLSKEDYTTLTEKNAEFYTLIIPTSKCPEGGIDETNYQSLVEAGTAKQKKAENSFKDPDVETTQSGKVEFSATVIGDDEGNEVAFPESVYNEPITAYSYYTYTDNETTVVQFSANSKSLSLAYVASALLYQGENDSFYYDIVDSVLGDTLAFEKTEYSLVQGYDETLTVAEKGLKVKYTSSDTSVATVDETGKVTAKKEGTTTITATVGDKTVTTTVSVKLLDILSGDTDVTKIGYKQGVILAQFGKDSGDDTRKITNNELTISGNDSVYNYTLPSAQLLTGYDIVIRYKDSVAINFLGENGKNFTGSSWVDIAYQAGSTKWGGYSGSTSGVSVVPDGDYYVLTIAASNFEGKTLKGLHLRNNNEGASTIAYVAAVKPLDILSGGDATELGYTGGTIIADFGADNGSATTYIKDGELHLDKQTANYSYTYTLPSAVSVGNCDLVIRYKGNVHLKLFDSQGGRFSSVDWADVSYMGWYSGGINGNDESKDGYHVLTISADKFTNTDLAKIEFLSFTGQNYANCVIDYIVAVPSSTVSE